MELQDICVKVLYDFEYSTKDGKFVRIHEGEKLFLIKKTNTDWWQVIRNSGSPFYVPASYVDVYKKLSNGNNKVAGDQIICNTEKTRSSSEGNDKETFVSVKERANSIDNNSSLKQKPKVAKRTIFPVLPSYENIPLDIESDKNSVIEIYQNLPSPNHAVKMQEETHQKSSAAPDNVGKQLEEDAEEADYVNLRVQGDGFVIDTDTCPDDSSTQLQHSSPSNQLSTSSSNLPLNNSNPGLSPCSSKSSLDTCIEEAGKRVFPKNHSVSSSSLDRINNITDHVNPNLKRIMKSVSSDDIKYMNTKKSNVNKLIESFSHEPPSLPHYNTVPASSTVVNTNDTNKLQYNGSFKTKYEREKWAKKVNLPQLSDSDVQLEEPVKKKSLETVKESLNEISHTSYHFLDDEDPNEEQDNNKENEESGGLEVQNVYVKDTHTEHSTDKILHSVNNVKNIRAKLESSISANEEVSKTHKLNIDTSVPQVHTIITDEIVQPNDGLCKTNIVIAPAESCKVIEIASESDYSGEVLSTSEKGSVDSLLELHLDDGDFSSDEHGCVKPDDNSNNKLMKEQENKKRRIALTRNRRVESCRQRVPVVGTSPPPGSSISPQLQPVKELFGGWSEYTTTDGRIYYCNKETGEKSWKPPRKRCNTDEDGTRSDNPCSGSSSPFGDGDEATSPIIEIPATPLPEGWTASVDADTGLSCYVNDVTGIKWFSSTDVEGRVYFFEENSNESSWTLPEVKPCPNESSNLARSSSQEFDPNVPQQPRLKESSGNDKSSRNTKSRSLILLDPTKKPVDPPPLTPTSKNWPQLWDGHMCVLREGSLTRTKITEHGKRLRKNWATSHVVLTELFLLFFKDAKQFHSIKTGGCVGRPELCVDLNGALIDKGDKISSRKNVFLISTVLRLQVLIQFESSQHADSWLLSIHNAIKNLPKGVDNRSRILSSSNNSSPESSDSKKCKIGRSKSIKLKKDGSVEDLTASADYTKIKARLKKFFHRRPTVDSLVKKGIYKDEPAFGCLLEDVCPSESPRVPRFVQRCIQCIEKSEENMKTDGLYRASGNLSQVQKIRLQVDQNNLAALDEEEDVHVLTGALKLFFRELKEPLIPYHAFNKALKASTNHNRTEKLSHFRDIAKSLPTPNRDTFKFLLQHLLRVTKYKEFNRMHIPNLAIVFGPTLMWSEVESKNMALDFMQQNLVVECFLVDFDNIFR